MTGRRRKPTKARDYEIFLGDFVEVYFKETQILRVNEDGSPVLANAVKGYVVDVTEHSLFLGTSPDIVYCALELSDIGAILVSENIADELKFPTPPDGEQH